MPLPYAKDKQTGVCQRSERLQKRGIELCFVEVNNFLSLFLGDNCLDIGADFGFNKGRR